MHVLALADGHGSPEHFRSDIGAEIATETVAELMPAFMGKLRGLVRGDVVAGVSAAPDPAVDALVRKFFAAIMTMWCGRILAHRRANPCEETMQSPARAYGCTLLGAACADGLWFAFQLGDGAVVALDADGALLPLPADPRCEGHVTTSMCSGSAADFRYRAGIVPPAAIMLCSDGLERCYDGLDSIAVDFFGPVIENLVKEGLDDTMSNLAELLPSLSAEYSHDDMSVSCAVDTVAAPALAEALAPKLADRYRDDLAAAEADYALLEERRRRLAEETAASDLAEAGRRASVLRSLDRQLAGIAEEIEYYKQKLNG